MIKKLMRAPVRAVVRAALFAGLLAVLFAGLFLGSCSAPKAGGGATLNAATATAGSVATNGAASSAALNTDDAAASSAAPQLMRFSGFAACPAYPALRPADFTAREYLVADISASPAQVLASKNPDAPRVLASLVKLMTALLAVEAMGNSLTAPPQNNTAQTFSLYERYLVLPEDVLSIPLDASRAGFAIGQRPTGFDLLSGLLIPSGADAANIIARIVAGSVQNFVRMMNARAAELGMRETVFADPTGLSPRNTGSARDAATLALSLLAQKTFDITGITSRTGMAWGGRFRPTTNMLIASGDAGVDGLKTGYTEEALFNMIATQTRAGRRLMAVVLGADGMTVREGARRRAQEARALLDYGFDNFVSARLTYRQNGIRVWGGRQKTLRARGDDARYAIPSQWVRGLSSSHTVFGDVWAPVAEGDVIGFVAYTYAYDEAGAPCIVANLPLQSAESVRAKRIRVFDKVHYFFYKLFSGKS